MSGGWRSKVHGRVLMPAAYRLLGDRRFALVEQLLERDGWSREQLLAHQARRVSQLFQMCQDHNPYWRAKFEEFSVRVNSGDPLAELAKLPVLTKDEVRANWRLMRSGHLRDSEVVVESSGGSTGMQVNLFQSRTYRELHAANEYRARAWMGIAPGEPLLAIQADGTYIKGKKRLLRSIRMAIERGNIIDGLQIDPPTARSALFAAAKRKPVHILGYTTPMVAIARIARELRLDWGSVRAVSTTAERLLDHDRELLGETYGAPVYDRYGSREVNSISMECSAGGHHVFSDLNVVEFAPLENADDEMNAIIVTPLDNEAMPLFRYRGGDEAAPVAGSCACGRGLPLMTGCRGRIANNFVTSDGRLINGGYFSRYFYHQEGFRAFQFHQTDVRTIQIYVAPDGALSEDRRRYLDSIVQSVHRDYPNQFDLRLNIVEEIPRRASGKHLFTISDVLLHV
ncbi:MAG TPA: hypothetical protein VNT79_17090 [Phycisphaerae bacterium]|nr:hypothetical protein [Phycisphaerae bacterium]